MHAPLVDQSSPAALSHRHRDDAATLKSSQRGHIAILYSGTVRTFTVAFHTHLVNLFAPSPYTVHIFAHFGSGKGDLKTPGVEQDHIALYRGFNATLRYYEGYTNLDNQYVSLMDDCLKWSKVEDTIDMEPTAHFNYTEMIRLIGGRYYPKSPPMSLIGALDSQRQVNQARLDYEKAHGIKYAWVLRMRMDHVMKSNVWEDVFDIQPVVNLTATPPPFLPFDLHLSKDANLHLHTHSHPPTANSSSFAELGLPQPWNGGVLYDMHYTPHPHLSLSSDDHDSSFFATTDDWWWSATDQFAMGGSAAMTAYSERLNVPLITQLLTNPVWQLWAEPYMAEGIVDAGLRVVPFRHVYNVLRHFATRESSSSLSYTPSRCVWIWYGKDAMKDHCPHWNGRQQQMLDVMLAASNDTLTAQQADEPYANMGEHAQHALSTYIDAVNAALADSLNSTASTTEELTAADSNYYYFWRYRNGRQQYRCEQPARSVYPEMADSAEAVQLPDYPPFDPYTYLIYPFLTETSDMAARSLYRQHKTCEQQ